MSEWTEERVREYIREWETVRDLQPNARLRNAAEANIGIGREILRLREEITKRDAMLKVDADLRRDGMEEAAKIAEKHWCDCRYAVVNKIREAAKGERA